MKIRTSLSPGASVSGRLPAAEQLARRSLLRRAGAFLVMVALVVACTELFQEPGPAPATLVLTFGPPPPGSSAARTPGIGVADADVPEPPNAATHTSAQLGRAIDGSANHVASDPVSALESAFSAVDEVRIRILRGDVILRDSTVQLAPEGEETKISVELDLERAETFAIQVELLLDGRPAFRDDVTVRVDAATVTEVRVDPKPVLEAVRIRNRDTVLTDIGESVQLTAEVVSVAGDLIPDLALTWETLDPEIVDVASDGSPTALVTALAPGDAAVVAAHGSLADTAVVSVLHDPAAAVVVEPGEETLQVGRTRQFTAIVLDGNGAPLEGRAVVWSSLNDAVATVDDDGVVLAVAPGEATIRATSGDVDGEARVTVVRPTVESVEVEPSELTLEVGQTRQFTATPRDSQGNPLTESPMTWISSSPQVATVNASGLVTAVGPGEATITATSEGVAGEARVTVVQVPAAIRIVSGDDQEAVVEGTLPEPLVVSVLDQRENPIPGVLVAWSARAGSGSVSPATSTTDASGVAGTEWTLGAEASQMVATAAVDGLEPVTFRATAHPEPEPQPAVVVRVSGDGQTAEVGTALPDPLAVEVRDEAGAPMAGVEVAWSVEQGGGSVSPARSTTNDRGRANTRWTLGPEPGEMQALATVDGLEPATFTATAEASPEPEPGPPAAIEVVSGDDQEGFKGHELREPLVARVVDEDGRPVPGVEVFWDLIEPPGADYGGDFSRYGPTDEDGLTSVRWTLSMLPLGQQLVEVSFADGEPVLFRATALPHPNERPEPLRVEVVAGDGQEGFANSRLPEPLVAVVIDQHGNPMPGEEIRWSIVGATTRSRGCLWAEHPDRCDPILAVRTDRAGESRVGWTLGGAVGTQRVLAEPTRGGDRRYPPSPANFQATATPPRVDSVDVQPDSHTIVLGETERFTATPQDADGNPLTGRQVEWSSSNTEVATVDDEGTVTGVATGEATIRATVEGVVGESQVTVTS